MAPAGERNGQGEGERKRLEQRGSVVGESGDGNKAAEGEETSEVALGEAKFFCFRGFKHVRITFFFSCAQRVRFAGFPLSTVCLPRGPFTDVGDG